MKGGYAFEKYSYLKKQQADWLAVDRVMMFCCMAARAAKSGWFYPERLNTGLKYTQPGFLFAQHLKGRRCRSSLDRYGCHL